jgi:hypothetical protein
MGVKAGHLFILSFCASSFISLANYTCLARLVLGLQERKKPSGNAGGQMLFDPFSDGISR